MAIFESIYVFGFLIATVIRTYFGTKFNRSHIEHLQKENPVVFIGMTLWAVALIAPFIVMFSDILSIADYQVPVTIRGIGAVIFISSLWVLLRSHIDLADNFSPSLIITKNHKLVTSGIYRRIRHPMYLSFYLWAIGQALLIDNWIAGPLGLFAFALIYLFRVKQEEQQLLKQFSDEYENYMKRTNRLFPKYPDA